MFDWFKKKEFQKGPALACVHYGYCSKEKCPLWVVLDDTYVDIKTKQPITKQEGKCAFAWIPQMTIELRGAVERLKPKEDKKDGEKTQVV